MSIITYLKNRLVQKPKIIVICGPTATGKTSLSIEIAKKYNGEVISADSRQVYIGLDIGSAKVTHEEMQGIPHYMIDVTNAQDVFSVQEYVMLARKKITEILARKKIPIICGGTGMYIDALIYNQSFPNVPANNELRNKLSKLNTEELFLQLQSKDPLRAQNIDHKNPVRLIRALEIIESLGKVPRQKQSKKYNVLFMGLDIPKQQHNKIIEKRIIERLENDNMLKEAEGLYAQGVSYTRMEELGLEYRYMAYYLQKKVSYSEMIQQLTTKTIQFAKRQRTWFKKNKNIHWFNPYNDTQEIESTIRKFIK